MTRVPAEGLGASADDMPMPIRPNTFQDFSGNTTEMTNALGDGSE
jgi:hypothetical protein